MKKPTVVYLLLGLTLLNFTCLTAQEKADELRQVVHQFYETGQFTGTVMVAQHGEILYEDTLGMANREWNIPHSTKGKFIIGSLSKQFMAALTLILQQEGKLQVTDKIIDHLSEYPESGIASKVRIHHLLSCSSGLPHYGAWEDFLEKEDRLTYSREDLLRKFEGIDLEFEPGTQYGYSSLGYLVLGWMLENAGGADLGTLLKEKIFDPSGMHDTSLDDQTSILPNRVSAYRYNYKTARYDNANYRDPSTTFSAGGVITTASDLLKWDSVLEGNKLLMGASKKQLFTPVHSNYAYGWRTILPRRSDSLEVHWHGGQVTGYMSMMARLPEDGYCIILLSNIRDMAYLDITNQLLNVLYDQRVERPRRSLLKCLLKEIVERDAEAAEQLYFQLKEKEEEQYTFSEVELIILGIELNSEGMYEPAVAMLELNRREYPESRYMLDNLYFLGVAYENAGKKKDALRCLEEALALDPENERVLRRVERLKSK